MLSKLYTKVGIAACTMLALLVAVAPARADITVTGTGKIVVVPDVAFITLAVVTEGSTADAALQANNVSMRKLFELLARLGIDERDVQTSRFGINAKYHHPKDSEPVLIGYSATNQITVRIRTIEDTGKVLDQLVKEGANRVTGVTFAVSDPEKHLGEARLRAMADARQKAEQFATGGNVAVGPIKSISEVSHAIPVHWRVESAALKEGVPLASGERELLVSINVVYRLGKS